MATKKSIKSATKTTAPAPVASSVTDEQIAHVLTHGRSVKEVAKTLKIEVAEAQARMKAGLRGYDLFSGPKNAAKDPTFVAIPKVSPEKPQPRIWTHQICEGKPYIVVEFPRTFDHQKIRIIPLDGILYGAPEHDSVRFGQVLDAILRQPNTFCYFNGDVIAPVTDVTAGRGAKEVKEQELINRAVEFEKLIMPIAHKILWAQQGCLEAKALKTQGFDPLQHFCESHGIPYFDQPVYADLSWKGCLWTLWTMHGHSTAQVKGAKINALSKPAAVQDYTHFIVGGHVGDAIWNRRIILCRNPVAGRVEPKEQFVITLGNFTKFFGTRAARLGHQPSSNQVVVLYLYPPDKDHADGSHHVKTRQGGYVGGKGGVS